MKKPARFCDEALAVSQELLQTHPNAWQLVECCQDYRRTVQALRSEFRIGARLVQRRFAIVRDDHDFRFTTCELEVLCRRRLVNAYRNGMKAIISPERVWFRRGPPMSIATFNCRTLKLSDATADAALGSDDQLLRLITFAQQRNVEALCVQEHRYRFDSGTSSTTRTVNGQQWVLHATSAD
jgi:hypothetical protein